MVNEYGHDCDHDYDQSRGYCGNICHNNGTSVKDEDYWPKIEPEYDCYHDRNEGYDGIGGYYDEGGQYVPPPGMRDTNAGMLKYDE